MDINEHSYLSFNIKVKADSLNCCSTCIFHWSCSG